MRRLAFSVKYKQQVKKASRKEIKVFKDSFESFLRDLSAAIIAFSPTRDGVTLGEERESPYSINNFVHHTYIYARGRKPSMSTAKRREYAEPYPYVQGLQALLKQVRDWRKGGVPKIINVTNNATSETGYKYAKKVLREGWASKPAYNPFHKAMLYVATDDKHDDFCGFLKLHDTIGK